MGRLLQGLILICCISTQFLSAQKIGGGEVYYKQLSRYKYLVTAVVYRQCSEAPLTQLKGYVISDSFDTPMNLIRQSISRINDTCGNPCNTTNSVSNPGFEKHVYTDTVNLADTPFYSSIKNGLCIVRFAIRQNLRDTRVTTMDTSGNFRTYYNEAMVNICYDVKSNHSPIFSFEPKLLACCNQPILYNPGVIDTMDFDSIGISIESPLINLSSSVVYSWGGLSKTIPISGYCPPIKGKVDCRALPNAKPPRGFYFDEITGDMIVTPVRCDEKAIVVFRASKYRKDSTGKFVLLGYVNREMMVSVRQCIDNNPPYKIGKNINTICEGKRLCLNLSAYDDPFLPYQTISDTVSVIWNYGIPEGVFEIEDSSKREKTAKFCWTPNKKLIKRMLRFGVMAYDKQCNIGMSSSGRVIYVNPSASIAQKEIKVKDCNKLTLNFFSKNDIEFPTSKLKVQYWVSSVHNPGITLHYSNKLSDSFLIAEKGLYIVKYEINNPPFNCVVLGNDTISVNHPKLEVAYARDTLFCQGDSVKLSVLNGDFSQYKFKWYDRYLGKFVADSGKEYTSKLHGFSNQIILQVNEGSTCMRRDTVDLISRGSYKITPSERIQNLCYGKSKVFKLDKIAGNGPFYYEWFLDDFPVGFDTVLAVVLFKSSNLKVKVTDSSQCYSEDTFNLKVVKLPEINMKDNQFCLGNNVVIHTNLSDKNMPLEYQWTLDNRLSSQNADSFKLTISGTHTLKLKINDSNACTAEKTILISFLPLPSFKITGDTLYHPTHYIRLSTDKIFNSYLWFNQTVLRQNNFRASDLGSPGYHKVWVEVTDSNGCKAREEKLINTNAFLSAYTQTTPQFIIYPNPVEETLHIVSETKVKCRIFNSEGKELMSHDLLEGENNIPMNQLPEGLYLLEVNGRFYKLIKL